ncbi:MAG: heme-binding protein [Rhodospirillaceae bacterium]|nr:heme-binding protein [Rhodospirillaceae bacterium]
MPLAVADTIIDSALAAGDGAGMLPLTVVVLDAGGHTVALKRQDGSGILRVDIATGKAWGALGMGIPSRTIRDRLGQRPAFQGALVGASDGRFVPVPGGVLVLDDDSKVIGAVGISGDTSEKDEYCAIHGIKAAGFAPAPGEPDEAWKDSGL